MPTFIPPTLNVEFNPPLTDLLPMLHARTFTVLSGANNTGKTLSLKLLGGYLGGISYLIGINRFYHVNEIENSTIPRGEVDHWTGSYWQRLPSAGINDEENKYSLDFVIRALNNDKRETLFTICGELLGNKFSLKRVNPLNDISAHYVDMDGQRLAISSTGTRLLMTMLGICLDEKFNTILIDEPELGLGPKLQARFSYFLQSTENRNKYFPHLERIVIATHSHLFLDRNDISNNLIVTKEANLISVNQVRTINDFHRLQFNLLGNTLESMFLPSAIVIVEGIADFNYIDQVLRINFPNNRITVINANGDGKVKEKVHQLKETLGDLSVSPFRERIFAILDQTHSPGLVQTLKSQGLMAENIIEWSRNGIEYFYPAEVVAAIYSCSEQQARSLDITGDIIEINGIRKIKNELSIEVSKRITASTVYPDEFKSKLLGRLKEVTC